MSPEQFDSISRRRSLLITAVRTIADNRYDNPSIADISHSTLAFRSSKKVELQQKISRAKQLPEYDASQTIFAVSDCQSQPVIILVRSDWFRGNSQSGIIHKPQLDDFLNLNKQNNRNFLVLEIPINLKLQLLKSPFALFSQYLNLTYSFIRALFRSRNWVIYGFTKWRIPFVFKILLRICTSIRKISTIGVITDIEKVDYLKTCESCAWMSRFLTYSPIEKVPQAIRNRTRRFLIFAHPYPSNHMEWNTRDVDIIFSGSTKYNRGVWLELSRQIAYSLNLQLVNYNSNFEIKPFSELMTNLQRSKLSLIFCMRAPGVDDFGIRSFWDAFLTGSVPIVQMEKLVENEKVFSKRLIPYRHYIPFSTYSELLAIIDLFKDDPETFKEISSNNYYVGKLLLNDFSNEERVLGY